jgi:hypothetical protein
MKKLHNPVGNFYRSKNKLCFWVRATMLYSQLNIMQQGGRYLHIYLAPLSKSLQNTLPQ